MFHINKKPEEFLLPVLLGWVNPRHPGLKVVHDDEERLFELPSFDSF
jgi:hypothetical protein